MRIAILGTRGIPNRYGGFEQFASFIAPMLVHRGHQVSVYNSSLNGYRESCWQGVEIITRRDPQKLLGGAGQFIYDLLCILDARQRGYELIFQLGYTSSSLWSSLFPREAALVTSLDGLEWRRAKYGWITRRFLTRAESWAVRSSRFLIADSRVIGTYLLRTYAAQALYIPYGAEPFENPDPAVLGPYDLAPREYDLMIARCEPENHPEIIIRGWLDADPGRTLVVVGNYHNRYGKILQQRYPDRRVRFISGLYDMQVLNNLRFHARLYFHGHSAGGTNPSLLEAMAAGCLIVAHDNPFNREVLGRNAFYFSHTEEITALASHIRYKCAYEAFLENNLRKIREQYSWDHIVDLIEQNIIRPLCR